MRIIVVLYFFLLSFSASSQNVSDSVTLSRIKNYYQIAIKFKDGKEVPMNYDSAFNYFTKAAALADPQSTYAIAYMYYKGLGCRQNYDTAAELFSKGATLGKDNSLYFYGLCWRNGYGRPKNEDSAKYYLKKSANLGYRQAMMELESKITENSNDSAAQILLTKVHNAALPDKMLLNHFTKIQPHLSSTDIIAGNYEGWVIQYDWSGKYIIQIKKLSVSLNYSNKKISGKWIENDSDIASINGIIADDSIVFNRTSYKRADHYSPIIKIQYDFQDGKLNLLQDGDSIFLAGNVEMFSPVRGEPSKPIFIALSRPGLKTLDSLFLKNLALSAYPNPFTNIVNIQFNLNKAASVEIQLYNTNGLLVYRKYANNLQKGAYVIPVSDLNATAGLYVVKLISQNHTATIEIIKQ